MSKAFTISILSFFLNYPYYNILFLFIFIFNLKKLTLIYLFGRRIPFQTGRMKKRRISPDQQWIIKHEKKNFYVRSKT
jgi:hypothetical protein